MISSTVLLTVILAAFASNAAAFYALVAVQGRRIDDLGTRFDRLETRFERVESEVAGLKAAVAIVEQRLARLGGD